MKTLVCQIARGKKNQSNDLIVEQWFSTLSLLELPMPNIPTLIGILNHTSTNVCTSPPSPKILMS